MEEKTKIINKTFVDILQLFEFNLLVTKDVAKAERLTKEMLDSNVDIYHKAANVYLPHIIVFVKEKYKLMKYNRMKTASLLVSVGWTHNKARQRVKKSPNEVQNCHLEDFTMLVPSSLEDREMFYNLAPVMQNIRKRLENDGIKIFNSK